MQVLVVSCTYSRSAAEFTSLSIQRQLATLLKFTAMAGVLAERKRSDKSAAVDGKRIYADQRSTVLELR